MATSAVERRRSELEQRADQLLFSLRTTETITPLVIPPPSSSRKRGRVDQPSYAFPKSGSRGGGGTSASAAASNEEDFSALSPLDALSPSVPAPSKSRKPDLSAVNAWMAGRRSFASSQGRAISAAATTKAGAPSSRSPTTIRGGRSTRQEPSIAKTMLFQRSSKPKQAPLAAPKVPYTSRYLQEAQRKAAARSAQASDELRRQRRQAENEWDLDTSERLPSPPTSSSPKRKSAASSSSLAAARGRMTKAKEATNALLHETEALVRGVGLGGGGEGAFPDLVMEPDGDDLEDEEGDLFGGRKRQQQQQQPLPSSSDLTRRARALPPTPSSVISHGLERHSSRLPSSPPPPSFSCRPAGVINRQTSTTSLSYDYHSTRRQTGIPLLPQGQDFVWVRSSATQTGRESALSGPKGVPVRRPIPGKTRATIKKRTRALSPIDPAMIARILAREGGGRDDGGAAATAAAAAAAAGGGGGGGRSQASIREGGGKVTSCQTASASFTLKTGERGRLILEGDSQEEEGGGAQQQQQQQQHHHHPPPSHQDLNALAQALQALGVSGIGTSSNGGGASNAAAADRGVTTATSSFAASSLAATTAAQIGSIIHTSNQAQLWAELEQRLDALEQHEEAIARRLGLERKVHDSTERRVDNNTFPRHKDHHEAGGKMVSIAAPGTDDLSWDRGGEESWIAGATSYHQQQQSRPKIQGLDVKIHRLQAHELGHYRQKFLNQRKAFEAKHIKSSLPISQIVQLFCEDLLESLVENSCAELEALLEEYAEEIFKAL